MLTAHRIALDPNNVQRTHFAKAAGVARFAYNWALAEWKKMYEAWRADNSLPRPDQMLLRRRLNAVKRAEFPWMLDVTKCAPQLAITQLGAAFQNFFAKRAKYPTFRKKGGHDQFSMSNDQFSVDGKRIRIPNLGWVRMREELRFNGKVMSATVSRVAGRWFVSVAVEVQDLNPPSGVQPHLTASGVQPHLTPKAESQNEAHEGTVGVDLGLASLATLSTGERVAGPKPHKALLKRLKRLSRGLSRKRKGSRNRDKARRKLARLHARIANVRSDALHRLTTDLTKRFHTIGIEDLNVGGMQKNRRLSRSVADMGLFEFRRQLEYKAERRGGRVVVADRFYPSSKTCSGCGHLLAELPLSARRWTCPGCGAEHDRDVNAAKNLMKLAASSAASACGGEGSGPSGVRPAAPDAGRRPRVKPAPSKQEANGGFGQV
jgi:putative transposase